MDNKFTIFTFFFCFVCLLWASMSLLGEVNNLRGQLSACQAPYMPVVPTDPVENF